VLQCVAVCCSVSQCVAVCCSVLHCVAVGYSVLQCGAACCSMSVCCSVMQCAAVYAAVRCTVLGKHCECIGQNCTHLERLPPLASHLLLPSHCVLIRHGGKKNCCTETYATSGTRTRFGWDQHPPVLYEQSYPMGRTEQNIQMPITSNFKSQLCWRNRKIHLTPKITNHLFTCYLDCMCKSKSRLPNSTMVRHYFVVVLCAMTLFSGLAWENWPSYFLWSICTFIE